VSAPERRAAASSGLRATSGAVERRCRWAVRALAVAATAVRLAVLASGSGDGRLLTADSESYRTVVRGLPSALWSPVARTVTDASFQRTPGYPLFLWLVGGFGSPSATATAVAQSVVGGAVLVLAVAAWARRIGGMGAAVVAAAIVAFDPASIGSASIVGSETLFTTLITVAAVALWQVREDNRRRSTVVATVAGACVGAAALVRPQGVVLIAAFAVVAWLVGSVARRQVTLACVATAALVVAPWVLRNGVVMDRWVVSSADGQNLFDLGASAVAAERNGVMWMPDSAVDADRRLDAARDALAAQHPGEIEMGNVIERDRAWTSIGVRTIASHPRGVVVSWAAGVVRILGGPADSVLSGVASDSGTQPLTPSADRAPPAGVSVTPPVSPTWLRACAFVWLGALLVGAAVGAAVCAARRDWRTLVAVAAPAGLYLATSGGPQASARFRVPITPTLAVFAAVAVVSLVHSRRSR